MGIKYNDWILDSEEELFFCHWVDELIQRGYVEEFYRVQEPIIIFEKVNFDFFVTEKSKIKQISKFILHPLTYTPDFYIRWAEKADGIFYATINGTYTKEAFNKCEFYCRDDRVSIVDVKGGWSGAKLISSVTFPVLQKILFFKDIYIQKVVPLTPKGLFSKTFTPTAYTVTPTGKYKRINWSVIHIDVFLNT